MKRLQADSTTGAIGKSGLTNEKCGNCDKYLEYIEKCEKEIEELQREVALLRKPGAK